MKSTLLEVRNLVKDFDVGTFPRARRVRILDGIDLRIDAGETAALVGESGCGKTTLARCILRLIDPTAGSVHFGGEDLLALTEPALRRKRRELQLIFQDALGSLDPRMTVEETLAEPFEVHHLGTRAQRCEWIRDLLHSVALDVSLLSRRPGALSGGQRQRVGIARALALKPRLLFADEPVAALDPSVQAQILNLLCDLQEKLGLTILLISHSLAVVRSTCSRVLVMYLGRIVEDTPSEAFFRGPRHPYSQLLMRSSPGFAGGLSGEAPVGEIPSPAERPAGCAFHPRCPHATAGCRAGIPQLHEIAPQNKVACFLYPLNVAPG